MLMSEAVAVVATSEVAQSQRATSCMLCMLVFECPVCILLIPFDSFVPLHVVHCQENHIMLDGIMSEKAHQPPWKKSIQAMPNRSKSEFSGRSGVAMNSTFAKVF